MWRMHGKLAVVCWGLTATLATGAYIEDSEESDRPVRVTQPPPVWVEPPVRPPSGAEAAVRDLLRRVEVGRALVGDGFAVFPLFVRGGGALRPVLTLDEAVRRGLLAVREQWDPQVAEVLARNDGRDPVFLMSGEMIAGGRQNRLIRDDVLLGPRGEFVAVPVYCAEQARWQGTDLLFGPADGLAGTGLRKHAAARAPQSGIWEAIDGRLREHEVSSPTRDYQALYRSPPMRRRIEEHVSWCRRRWPTGAAGAALMLGGDVMVMDIFEDPRLLDGLWWKLMAAHYLDGAAKSWDEPRRPDGEVVRELLRAAQRAAFERRYTPADGELLGLAGPAFGSALVWNGQVVHVQLFAGYDAIPLRDRQ